MKIPTNVPALGFYYHYKHDPIKGIQDYAYEVIGVGVHTEDDCRPEDANMVIYRPLYEASVFKAGKLFDLRPLDMWMGEVEKNGKVFKRFSQVTDPKIISELQKIKENMYGRE
ncbi:MAG TPA: DUF1653 domain-containing protein [Candidatus Nanoarchaeia archaeon]|nr:DUF1653 domain-containing protein [Candidatus Nanoarchaeia archaeon]